MFAWVKQLFSRKLLPVPHTLLDGGVLLVVRIPGGLTLKEVERHVLLSDEMNFLRRLCQRDHPAQEFALYQLDRLNDVSREVRQNPPATSVDGKGQN